MSESITCYIYRSSAKADLYVYLLEKDSFDCLPAELRAGFARLDFAMELELNAQRKLAKENTAEVIKNLQSQGFHIQMPSDTPIDDLLARIAAENLKKNQSPEAD